MLHLSLRQVIQLFCMVAYNSASTPSGSLAGLAIGTKRGLNKPLPTADLGRQPRHVFSKGQTGTAPASGLGQASQQEAQELQYATLAQSVAEGPVLKSLVVGAPYLALQFISNVESIGLGHISGFM